MKNNIFASCEKQLYKYDCGAMSLHNILNSFFQKNLLNYEDILGQLQTTTFWWTFPKRIESFLGAYQVPYHSDIANIRLDSWNIFLIDGNKFYKDGVDYGHYFVSHKVDDDLHHVFDVWDGTTHIVEEKDLLKLTKDVLVWKTRFHGVCFSFNPA